jgi:hypothetical protein
MNPWLDSKKIISRNKRDINDLTLASIHHGLTCVMSLIPLLTSSFYLHTHIPTHLWKTKFHQKPFNVVIITIEHDDELVQKWKKSKVKHLIATSNFVKFHHCIMNDNDHKTKQKLYSPYFFVVTFLCIQAIEIVKAWKISRLISMSFNLKKI